MDDFSFWCTLAGDFQRETELPGSHRRTLYNITEPNDTMCPAQPHRHCYGPPTATITTTAALTGQRLSRDHHLPSVTVAAHERPPTNQLSGTSLFPQAVTLAVVKLVELNSHSKQLNLLD